MPRALSLLVIHCSASPNAATLFSGQYGTPGFRDPVTEIDGWHRERGFQRESYWRGRQNANLTAIGYHYVIARNGALFTGRHEDEPGEHVRGWNAPSLGLCLVGMDAFTRQQWLQLKATVEGVCQRLGIALAPPVLTDHDGKRRVVCGGVCGHRDIPGVAKACPGFNVGDWLAGGLAPLAGHVAEAGL